MSRRLEIELTSKQEGSWTWRAAGALQPKGTVDAAMVPAGASVKDVLRAEVETDLDGTRVLSIQTPKQKAERSGFLEILPSSKPFQPVTEQRQKKERRSDDRRGPRRDRPAGKDGARGERGERPQRDRRPRFDAPPEVPQRPKALRIRPGRKHIDAVLADLPEAQRTIAEKVLSGGVPAVRAAIEEQNRAAVAAGQEKVPAEGLVQMAEQLLPRLRVAEWLDKAASAQQIIKNIDLRDLRAIVTASNDPAIARDESTRTVAESMKAALVVRQEEETKNWIEDIQAATKVGRVVRALNLAAQPPKAGQPFPPALAKELAAATTAALTLDAPAERWVILLEAAAFSPVRTLVTPATPSGQVSEELTKTVIRLAPLMPHIAALFGVVVDPKAPTPRPLRPERPVRKKPGQKADTAGKREDKPRRGPRPDSAKSGAPGAQAAPVAGKEPGSSATDEDAVQPAVEVETSVEATVESEATAPITADDAG